MQRIESALNNWHYWPGRYPRLFRMLFKNTRRGSRDRQSLNQALGHPPDARLLIINLDDAGLCGCHNAAIAEALEHGAATSCTLMTMTPGFQEFARMAREHPHWSVGVHLVLNAEWPRLRWGPVLDVSRVPSLVDREGCFYPTLFEAIWKTRIDEVREEWRAQILKALEAGVQVDHIDCHMGPYHFRPAFFRTARDLAQEFRLGMRVVAPWRQLPCRAKGVPCGDWAVINPHREGGKRVWHTEEDRRRQLLSRFRDLQPGISLWWTHISLDDEEWRSIRPPDEDLDKEDYPGEHRDQYEERIVDYGVLSDSSFREEIEGLGVRLISYRDLKNLADRWAEGTSSCG